MGRCAGWNDKPSNTERYTMTIVISFIAGMVYVKLMDYLWEHINKPLWKKKDTYKGHDRFCASQIMMLPTNPPQYAKCDCGLE